MRRRFALIALLAAAVAMPGCDWFSENEIPEPPLQKFQPLIQKCYEGLKDNETFVLQIQMGVKDGGVIFKCDYSELALY